jgi:hypothetical protein
VVTVRFDDTVRVGSGNAAVANAGGGSVQAARTRAGPRPDDPAERPPAQR